MKNSIFGGLVLATCLVACGSGTTTGTDGTGSGTTGTGTTGTGTTGTGTTGTGDSGTGTTGTGTTGTSGTSAFIGTWTLDEGMAEFVCPGGTTTATFGATLTIMAGLTADEVTTSSTATGGTCVNTFTVSGTAATPAPGSPGCTLMYTDSSTGLEETEQRTNSGSFTLNGTILTVNAGGTDTISEGGQSMVCTIGGTGTYTKVSN